MLLQNLFSSQELVDILDKNRINNSRLSVTGLLLYNDGSILQILEGEKVVKRQLFNKIMLDNRHNALIKAVDGSIKERSFQDWSMGLKEVSSENWSKLDGWKTRR